MTDPTKDFTNLRRVPRRSFEAIVGILYQGQYSLERSFQVGEGGMMVASSRVIKPGEMVVVSFVIDQDTIVMVRGTIRNELAANEKINAPIRYNIEFHDLQFQFKRAIRNFVAAATHAEGLNALSTIY